MIPFLHSTGFKVLFSIVLGFGLSTIVQSKCKDASCMNFTGVNVFEVDPNAVYAFGKKCYSFQLKDTKCIRSKKIITFA
jgi:hypothetical protein